jgi:hypothetical protein
LRNEFQNLASDFALVLASLGRRLFDEENENSVTPRRVLGECTFGND